MIPLSCIRINAVLEVFLYIQEAELVPARFLRYTWFDFDRGKTVGVINDVKYLIRLPLTAVWEEQTCAKSYRTPFEESVNTACLWVSDCTFSCISDTNSKSGVSHDGVRRKACWFTNNIVLPLRFINIAKTRTCSEILLQCTLFNDTGRYNYLRFLLTRL